MDDRFSHDAFFIDQLIKPIANLYRVSTLGSDEQSPGDPVAFVRQKKLALKEDIRFMADEQESEELFRLKARAIMEFRTRYDVILPDGEIIGTLQKVFGASLFRSRWKVLGPDEQEIGEAYEKRMSVALLRRIIDVVPYGELVPVVFHFTIAVDGREVGTMRRPIGLRDRYVFDLTGDADRRLDRRVAVALGIALDALQSR